MMHFSPLSPLAWSKITRGAVSWKQRFDSDDGFHRYRVTYPNGYGAFIIGFPSSFGNEDSWEVGLMKGNALFEDDEGYDYVYSDLSTEEEVIKLCDSFFYL